MEKIIVGQIVKPQGLSGELKIKPLIQNMGVFNTLTHVSVGDKILTIASVSARMGFIYMRFENIDNIFKAGTLRGKFISIDKNIITDTLKDNEYLIEDIIGYEVLDDNGVKIGKLKSVENYGSTDVYFVKQTGGQLLFPNVPEIIKDIDSINKRIILSSRKLKEVAIYED